MFCNPELDMAIKENLAKNKVLNFLKDFQWYISTLIFFAGGLIWLYAAFATMAYVESIKTSHEKLIETVRKTNAASIEKVQCLVNGQIDLNRMNKELESITNNYNTTSDLVRSYKERLASDQTNSKQLKDKIESQMRKLGEFKELREAKLKLIEVKSETIIGKSSCKNSNNEVLADHDTKA